MVREKKADVVSYEVIRDTREQRGWVFEPSDRCLGTVVETLKTGDYTLRGFEDAFCLERKRNVAELSTNLTHTDNWSAFKRELERLEAFRFPFLICEFSLEDLMRFPEGSGIPQARWASLRVKPAFLLKRIHEIHFRFKPQIIFAGGHGKEVASSLFKRMSEYAI